MLKVILEFYSSLWGPQKQILGQELMWKLFIKKFSKEKPVKEWRSGQQIKKKGSKDANI